MSLSSLLSADMKKRTASSHEIRYWFRNEAKRSFFPLIIWCFNSNVFLPLMTYAMSIIIIHQVGRYTYTSDQRFTCIHLDDSDDWTLEIKYVQKDDAGVYECQAWVFFISHHHDHVFSSDCHLFWQHDSWRTNETNITNLIYPRMSPSKFAYRKNRSTEPKMSLSISLTVIGKITFLFPPFFPITMNLVVWLLRRL